MASNPQSDAVATSPDQADLLAQAFRARYQEFDRLIPTLFRNDHPCCATLEIEPSVIGDDGDIEMLDVGADAHHPPPPPRPPKVRVEEDYDFDDDDEDEEPSKPVVPTLAATVATPPRPQTNQSPSSSTSAPSQSGAPGGSSEVKVTREKLEADRKAAENSARHAFETLFFTLENDRDAMLEQRQLEESDRQVNAEANAVTEQQPGKLASANLGASNLTLKHLIARIDATRERVKVSDMELRNLMSEVRKNRSKWASEDKIGQEELYEAAEKVVLELRANTEHSTAFLNRVNKREAPDYYQVIKQPMDLGTVMKKLKQHQYKSKKEFVDDLNRIWDNCLTYNADPSHFLRKHAKAMKTMTASLEPLIPDIVIRDRAEVEAEEAGQVDAEGESDDEPIMSSRGRKAPGSKKSRKGAAAAPREGTPDVKPPTIHLARADSNPPGNNDAHSQNLSVNGFPTPTGGTPGPNGVAGSITQLDLEEDDYVGDLEYQSWKKITKKGRAKVASQRHKLIRGTRLNPEEPALIRSRIGMGRAIQKSLRHLKGMEDEQDEDIPTVTEEGEGEDDQWLLPDYYDPLSCVPELPWRTVWAADEGEVEMPDTDENALRLAPRGLFVQPRSQINTILDANLKKMQDTRKVCSKITVIKQMQMQTQIYPNQFTKYDPKEFVEQDVDDFVISEPGPIMCRNVARASLQRSLGKLFYHAGFEEFQPSALEVATDIATDYFQKIGKTLMVYAEAPQHDRTFTPEEIILHTLNENGSDVESLQSYVRDDIERLGTKLSTINERMKSYLAELLRPALADTGGDDSKLFNDGSEQFVGGDFAEDIGDDFFGFKELGLDKEFGLASLSVPLHLLQGRMHNAYQPTSATNAAASGELHKPPPPFEPLTQTLIKSQIQLIQPFFLERFNTSTTIPVPIHPITVPASPPNSDSNTVTNDTTTTTVGDSQPAPAVETEEALLEDEDLPVKQRPPKPRLPPTGKISMPRKRPLQAQGGGSKKKKKPNPVINASPTKGGSKGGDMLEGKDNRKESVGAQGMVRSFSKMSEDGGAQGMMSPESLVA